MVPKEAAAVTGWKRLWQLVSGIHHETPEETVDEELSCVSKQIQDGVLQYEPASASKQTIEDLLNEKKQQKMLAFAQLLQELLDLESKQCWDILCYYLANEYRGTASSLTVLISSENNMSKLLNDIWGFYSLERMIVLKIVKNVLLFCKVANHPYQRQYKNLLDKISLPKLRESYLKQLEHLTTESPPKKLAAGEFFDYRAKLTMWSERNAREINEVLHILLLIAEHERMKLPQIKSLFNCFKQHSFGKLERYLSSNNSVHVELSRRMTYSEVLLFLKCIDFENAENNAELAEKLIDAIEKDIVLMSHNAENGPICVAWLIMYIRCTNVAEDERRFARVRQFGKRAVDLNCFAYMHSMLTNAMFHDDSLVSKIARKTIYNLLNHLCDFFDVDNACSRHPFIYELLCELLSWPALAQDFCSSSDVGVRSLFNTLLENFPFDFEKLSNVATALTKAGMGDYIRAELEALPIFCDFYDESKYALRVVQDDECIVTNSVQPFVRIDYTIEANSTALISQRADKYILHIRFPVNYFNELHHEINCLLEESTYHHDDFENNQRMRFVNSGLEFLHVAIQRAKALAEISVEMVHPTEMCIDILNKFKILKNPPIELFSNCLNVCTALLALVDQEILTRIINLNILPKLSNDSLNDFKKYSMGVCFEAQLIGNYLVDVEKKRERYDFLLAYLSFLRTYTKLQRQQLLQVEIPGLIFLLREVFPHMHSWRFEKPLEKNKIYAEIMGFICDILDAVSSSCNPQKQKQLLRDICVYSLLNLENGIILLRFVALGNAYLQHTMEMESNWMQQQPYGLVLLVRLSMRILMQLLRLKGTIAEFSELSPLEALIYTQPKQRDTLRIIPVVTSYMSNIFDRWLPILSCRLLKRIALEFNMSLLACLDMEADQIRLTFLQKLPDELESDSLKIAILELVEACVEKQPGMTEAFFKVNYAQEKRLFGKEIDTEIAESILSSIEDFLQAVGKQPQTVMQPLPSKIMNLIHTLWKHNMQVLVEELILKKTFWSQLCNPLFTDLRTNCRAYTQLTNILAIELFRSGVDNAELLKVMNKFFEATQFKKWLQFVFDIQETPIPIDALQQQCTTLRDDVPEWLGRLQAFKSFLLVLLKKQPQIYSIPTKQYKLLAQKCLDLLVKRAQYVPDLRPFILLSEMFMHIVLSLKHSFTENEQEDRQVLQQLVSLLNALLCSYEDMHTRAKEACLAVTIRCADLMADSLLADANLGLSFLQPVVGIICCELNGLEKCVKAANSVQTSDECLANSTILSLNLLKTVGAIFQSQGPNDWDRPFVVNKVFQRLLSCTSYTLQSFAKQSLSVELLEVLLFFAKGNYCDELLHCDVGDYLWLQLLPPKELLEANYLQQATNNSGNAWTVQKWWPVYARGIELVATIFRKQRHLFLKQTLQFVGIHEEYLVDSMLLAKQSLEPLAIKLIKSAAALVTELAKFKDAWRLEQSQSFFSLMRAVQILLGHCISLFHQPKNVKLLLCNQRTQLQLLRENKLIELNNDLVAAFDGLNEIIILCVKTLQSFSPDLLELICAPVFLISPWELIFEIHFGAPKINEDAFSLTFGTVLSIVGVYVKVLNLQNHAFTEVPLNTLPTNGEFEMEQINTTRVPRTQREHSKSLSVVSHRSVSCPPNELLNSLDGELCLLALEHVLTLAASQSMLALKNQTLSMREKQLIKREISSEVFMYQEFVRKKVIVEYRDQKDMWKRRKQGQIAMTTKLNITTVPTVNSSKPSNSTADVNRRSSTDLRINVVRRMHLQQQQQRSHAANAQETSQSTSPSSSVVSGKSFAVAAASTPNVEKQEQERLNIVSPVIEPRRRNVARDMDAIEEDEEEMIAYPPVDPRYTSLSYVKVVEEDYLHFLFNLFTVICQTD